MDLFQVLLKRLLIHASLLKRIVCKRPFIAKLMQLLLTFGGGGFVNLLLDIRSYQRHRSPLLLARGTVMLELVANLKEVQVEQFATKSQVRCAVG